jgi:hypothetical protein
LVRAYSSGDFFITADWKSAMARTHPFLRASSATKASAVMYLLSCATYQAVSFGVFLIYAPGTNSASFVRKSV